jgi:uracil-DNA glycosylase
MTDASFCISCSGAGIIFNAKGAKTCPKCGGTGKIKPSGLPFKKIVLLGEAWGAEEARMGLPFVGASGNELRRMLEEAEIEYHECFPTNVFNLQPQPTNDIKNLGVAKGESRNPMPAMGKAGNREFYVADAYFPHLERLWKELDEIRPNLVVALGNTAMWALTGNYGIRNMRGTVMESTYGVQGLKVLPTYHPAAVLRDWSIRAIVVADLMKAKRQSAFPEVRRPSRQIWVDPDLKDIEFFYFNHILKSSKLSIDIETKGDQITEIGFAPSPNIALVVPFFDHRKKDGSYWPTAHQEKLAVRWCHRILQHEERPEIEIVGQNFLFDANWIWHKLGGTPKNFVRDTMLKHHAMNPEFEKSLGFLGSIYTDEPAWKTMRSWKNDSTKRGD